MNRRQFIQSLAIAGIAAQVPPLLAGAPLDQGEAIKDYLYRIRNPDNHYDQDYRANDQMTQTLIKVSERLKRVQRVVGYGNFNIISFDDALKISKRYSRIGDFESRETQLIEQLFYEDAGIYGFSGEKTMDKLTTSISRKDVKKISGSGHYLFKGKPTALYSDIRRSVGDQVILTSGIRGVVKQMSLFLNKASRHEGNLSLASRSLAPPGYSFHGTGDFDVGRSGWGSLNFTEAFATTEEFKRLIDLGYIDIRYPIDNRLGVRFEPWHIKVG
ncbi:MAG: M15 family metallopeptidase [Sedimenticola sp.]|nr:M15 family metallopeptidase [Sedimenticola sp.]